MAFRPPVGRKGLQEFDIFRVSLDNLQQAIAASEGRVLLSALAAAEGPPRFCLRQLQPSALCANSLGIIGLHLRVDRIPWLGPGVADSNDVVDALKRKLPATIKGDLIKARPVMTAWVADVVARIAA